MKVKVTARSEVRNVNHHLVCVIKTLDNNTQRIEIQRDDLVSSLLVDDHGKIVRLPDRNAKAS